MSLAEAATRGQAGLALGDRLRAERGRLATGAPHGAAYAVSLSAATDEGLQALYEALDLSGIAVVATGGYGRGRLAPYSDIDLLLLTAPGREEEAERFVYPLWDANLPLSQSVHGPAGAVDQGRADITCRTAFLDARLVAGDPDLFAAFRAGYDDLRRTTKQAFVEAKLAEREERHRAQDASRYAIEPDVKEGKGGLRDLDLLHWLDRYTAGIDEAPVQRTQTPGLFTPGEARRLKRCQDFLWSVRVPLHRAHGRADERLSFAVQPRLADELGYHERAGAPAAERLMRHYFLNATEVGRLTGAACAALEEAAVRRPVRPRLRDRLFGQEPQAPTDPRFVLRGERLAFADADGTSIGDAFAMFEAASEAGAKLHPDALATMARTARTIRRAERRDPALTAAFRRLLARPDAPRTLRRMNECGLLGAYLPAYGRIVGRTEYGLYRRYTLDEHVLRACEVYGSLRAGELSEGFELTQPVARASDPVTVYLALLLQETEAGVAQPTPGRVAGRVRRTARRFVDEPVAEDVAFLTERIDLLARTAARRAVTDPETVARVAGIASTRERIDLLALVTACRHRTAGAGSWRAYSNRDARLLVEEVRAFLAGGRLALATFAEERRLALRGEAKALTALPGEAMEAFFARTGPEFWSMASPPAAARLAEVVTEADEAGEAVAASVRAQDDGTVRAIVYSPDRTGLFADVAGVVTEAGGTVWGASAFSLDAPGALDAPGTEGARGGVGPDRAVTIVEMLRPGTPPEPYALGLGEADRIVARLVQIARDGAPPPRLPGVNVSDRRAVFEVAAAVRAYDEAADSLIVEAEGLDRPGLLHLLAEEIEAVGASIRRAFVATKGERAIDTFYLQDANGQKLTDEGVMNALHERLLGVLRD